MSLSRIYTCTVSSPREPMSDYPIPPFPEPDREPEDDDDG